MADDIDWSKYCVVHISEYDDMRAEIERLRAANATDDSVSRPTVSQVIQTQSTANDLAHFILTAAAERNRNSTHYGGCWQHHPMCMAVHAANHLFALHGAGERLAAAVRRTPCDCSPTCTCGNLAALTNWETLNRD